MARASGDLSVPMKTFGLTGGVGMGKSTSAQFLRSRGIPVVDTDDLARQFVEPGQFALAEIRRTFGPEILDAEGRLRRDELARRVFADPEARAKLEAILHPPIRFYWQAQLGLWRTQGQARAVVVIPLLFETAAESHFDATICVACTAATQRLRLSARTWSAEQIDQRIQAQWSIERKMAKADFVVWTEGDLDLHAEQLARIVPESGLASRGT
jgi:dephospho-CoA kinase